MSSSLTPSKRPSDGSITGSNSRRKVQTSAAKSPGKPSSASAGKTVFRVLCPSSKVDAVVGDVRKETGSRVLVEEAAPGYDERVIVITTAELGNGNEGDEDMQNHDNDREDKETITGKDTKAGGDGASLQKALLLIFEKLIDGSVSENGNGDDGKAVPFRLLVLSSHTGCLLGKAGVVIKKMSADSGAEIRILPKDKIPPFVSASDQLVQISGKVDAVRKALQLVSQQLLENASRDKGTLHANPSGSSSQSPGNSTSRQEPRHTLKHISAQKIASLASRPRDVGDLHPQIPPISRFHGSGLDIRMNPSHERLSFRILCSSERVGGIIGKGGTVVNTIQQETGCEIQVVEGHSDSEERIIVVSGPAHPEDRVSAVQDAVLRVQNRILRATPDNKDSSMTSRILVKTNQIGCLLGKGGSIIAEMRKSSGAYIRKLGKDQVPKCASEDEEVVQVDGEYDSVQEAIFQITSRLKFQFFRDILPSIDYPPNPAHFDPVPQFMRREFSPPPRIYPNFGPSIPEFDPVGGTGSFHPRDDRHFVRNIVGPGLPQDMPERGPWGPEGPVDGGGPFGFQDFPRGPPRRLPGFVGGPGPAIITNTTIEVVVPRSIVPSIYGEDGWSLKQIRMISDAKITITEPAPEAAETVIIISGTPEETHAAQSLIQAFVMLENEEIRHV